MFKPDIEIIKDNRYRGFLRLAYQYAWDNSPDPSTKIGAILVNELDQIVSYGTNHIPNHNPTREQLMDRAWKLTNSKHAEPSAIDNSLEIGIDPEGFTMVLPWIPCFSCAEYIVSHYLGYIVAHKQMVEQTPERWIDDLAKAITYLRNNQVELYMYDGRIGGVESLFDGKLWSP